VKCVKVGPRPTQHSEAGRWQGLDWGSMAHPIANGGDVVSHIQTKTASGAEWVASQGRRSGAAICVDKTGKLA
jgi:hypothetical protein